MGWSKKYKKSIDCNNPRGFSQKAHCAGRKKQESKMSLKLEELVGKRLTEEQFDEAAGKKDACYHKVKARYDVWPSAYASGALVKCRKVGAKNWGNKSKKEGVDEKVLGGKDMTSGIDKNTKITFDKRIMNKKLAGKTFVVVKKGINTFNVRPDGSGNERDTKTLDAPTLLKLVKNRTISKIVNSKGKAIHEQSVNEGDIESRELKLYIDNDSQLYNSRFMPIMKNLSKKMKKGKFDKKLAIKGFMYLVDDGAKKYVKDHGGNAKEMFSKKDRIAVASDLADEFEDAYKNKEYSFMESINEGRVLHFTQIKDKTLEKHLKVIAKKVGATVSKISGGFKVDADNDGRKLAQVVDYIFDKSLMKGLMSGGGMSRVQLVNEESGNVIDEGLGDMVGKSIGKYNKKRKKNMDALKKLKKKEGVNETKNIKLSKDGYVKQIHHPMTNKMLKSVKVNGKVYRYNSTYKTYNSVKGNELLHKSDVDNIRYESVNEKRGTCWVGYQQKGMKEKNGRMVPNCVKEIIEIFYEENGEGHGYTLEHIKDLSLNEAEYQGRKVKLGKIMQGDTKKFKVYVKNPKGNVVKVNFGQGGKAKGGTMRIRKSNPKARANFRARHNCDNPGPRHKARYWSCRKW